MNPLADFHKRFKTYTDSELDGIADLLFQEVEMEYSSTGRPATRLHLGVLATKNFSMRGSDVNRCIEIMETRYAGDLGKMGYVKKHDA